VVPRSNYLLGWGGPALRYTEGTQAPSWAAAKGIALASVAAVGAMRARWLHPLLRRVLPAQGEGPSREKMLGGHWLHRVVGASASGAVVEVRVGDPHRDPGYWGTSRMLLEAALCIALQRRELEADPGLLRGGVLTPASAMGAVLVARLRGAGVALEVVEATPAAE
jgi:short subunit dehydrogenase-like uncharacterized protein